MHVTYSLGKMSLCIFENSACMGACTHWSDTLLCCGRKLRAYNTCIIGHCCSWRRKKFVLWHWRQARTLQSLLVLPSINTTFGGDVLPEAILIKNILEELLASLVRSVPLKVNLHVQFYNAIWWRDFCSFWFNQFCVFITLVRTVLL